MQFYKTQEFKAGDKTYNGFGNPGAWILVIGNEPAFDVVDGPVDGQNDGLVDGRFNGRLEGAAARKYQRFVDGLTWRKRKTRFEYYNRIFFVDIRQIIGQDIWLTDEDLIKTYFAAEFEGLLKCSFERQFPIIIFSLEHEVWHYEIDIARLLNVKMQGGLVEGFDKRQWYIAYKHKSGNKPRLVLHTRQVSHKETNREWLDMVSSAILAFSLKHDFFILDPNRVSTPGIPREAYVFSDFISDVVHAASFLPGEGPKIKCRRKRCTGTMIIGHDDEENITYKCSECDKSTGLILKRNEG